MALHTTKSMLRKEILSRVAALSSEERSRQSELVQTAVLGTKAFKQAKHISVYISLPKEVCTSRIIDAILADKEKVLYVPDIIHGTETAQMEMLQVFSKEDLSHFEKKELDVLCPTHDKPRSNPLSDDGEGLDLVIMPGVAFDDAGGRMGRGKGYYDRYLDRVKDFHAKKNKPMPTLIALAFDEQIVDEVPRSPTDRITDLVLHAKRIQESQSSA